MISVKKQRIAAITVLISVVLRFLLSLNFRIWSGFYTENDLESIVIQQMDSLETGNSEDDTDEKIFLRFCEYIYLSGIGIMLFLVRERFTRTCLEAFSFRPGVTLRSLQERLSGFCVA